MDAGNMLKPMLARGELRMVGATTLDEYRQHIEKDPALERRFQQVLVGEPSVEDTIAILRGLKGRYEAHHKVDISDSALVAAATLSDRYITSRFLPDKAIDLVDEAASRLRMEIDSRPVEIDELQRAVDRARMEMLALERETDAASQRAAGRAAPRHRRPRGAAAVADGPLGAREGRPERRRRAQAAARRRCASRPRTPSAATTSRRRRGCSTPRSPRSRRSSRPPPSVTEERGAMVKEHVGARRRRRGRQRLDRHPRRPDARGRDRQAAAHGGGARRAARRAAARPSRRCRTPSAAPAPASPTPTAPPARSCSSARPASARPSSPRRSPRSCSTTSAP